MAQKPAAQPGKRHCRRHAGRDEKGHHRDAGAFFATPKNMYVYEMIQEMARLTSGALTFNTLYIAIYRLQERSSSARRKSALRKTAPGCILPLPKRGRRICKN